MSTEAGEHVAEGARGQGNNRTCPRGGAADVTINGQVVTGYYLINAVNGLQYEVADVPLAPGDQPEVYLAESDDPLGVMVIGDQSSGGFASAYAYPGGMALKPLVQR